MSRFFKTTGLVLIALFTGFAYNTPQVTGALAPFFAKTADLVGQTQGTLTNFLSTFIVFLVISLVIAVIAQRFDGHSN